jgi:hypothetical protein
VTASWVVGVAYVLVAAATLLGSGARRRTAGVASWLVEAALWPFFLPARMAPPSPSVRATRGPYAERLGALSHALAEALDDPSAAGLLARPRAELEEGVRRLVHEAERLEALERAIEGALEAARPRLVALRTRGEAQLGERLRLMEEVVAQLTVLRFVDLSAPDGAREERLRVESLLVQLDALVAMGTPAES